jgi:hypothetical protein
MKILATEGGRGHGYGRLQETTVSDGDISAELLDHPTVDRQNMVDGQEDGHVGH